MNTTFNKQKGELRLKLRGDILSTNADHRAREIGAALEENDEVVLVIIDLNSAKIIDSMGLNMLLGIIKRAQEKGMRVEFHIASQSIKRLFDFARMEDLAVVRCRERRTRTRKSM